MGLIPGLGRSSGEGHDNPLQYSCLENSTDRGSWPATVHGITKSQIQLKRLSTHKHLTLCDPLNCSLPGSSDHEIFQERILELVAISFSRGSSQPQGWDLRLLHCRQIPYILNYQGSTAFSMACCNCYILPCFHSFQYINVHHFLQN